MGWKFLVLYSIGSNELDGCQMVMAMMGIHLEFYHFYHWHRDVVGSWLMLEALTE